MFKVGPALIMNHGMGFGSLSIAMHELIKMLHYAEAQDVSFLRLGTCGGVGQVVRIIQTYSADNSCFLNNKYSLHSLENFLWYSG